MTKLIILDRDGVINNDSDNYIKSPDEWQPIPGSLAAIARLKQAGYQIGVATNQAGIAYGLYDETTLINIHHKMHAMLATFGGTIDAIAYCPHQSSDGCACRKPKPGLLIQIAEQLQLSLNHTVAFIGDKKSDIDAALAAGCKPILVKTGYGEQTLAANPWLTIPVFANLGEAVEKILLEDQ